MGKKSKRPARAARSVHDRIRAQAEQLRSATTFGVREAAEMPETEALMSAAVSALKAAVPKSFVFEGRAYWLRCELAVRVAIFDTPGSAIPLIRGLSLSTDSAGHVPAH